MLTSIIMLLLLIVFSWIGLSYFDPPISYGMEVNFGTTSQGKGKTPPKTQPKQVEQQQVNAKAEITKTSPKVTEVKAPKVLTQKYPSVPIIKNKIEKISTPKISEIKTPTNEVKEEVIQESPKPTVSKSTKQVLSNLFNNSNKSEESSQGEGDDEEVGDKGKTEGNPYTNSYYGTAGLGGKGDGFGLNGRSLKNQGSVTQECNQEGVVVVRITVDKSGTVVLAEAGVKGTTNSHPCLLAPAEKTAYLHKWFSDTNAPNKQVGFVVVNFKLGE
ncbi:energy transducer TonB [Candidatus Arcticimaribacter]|nr:energy transducer TonB [Candidatus Arcticimaribacter sp.]MDA9638637.1 energy transducer TonB [Candidatus Arcticimaribacter sp.]